MDQQNESPEILKLKEHCARLQGEFEEAAKQPALLAACNELRQAEYNYQQAKGKAELARTVKQLPKFTESNGVPQFPKEPEPSFLQRFFSFILPGDASKKALPEERLESEARNNRDHVREVFNEQKMVLRKKAFAVVSARAALQCALGNKATDNEALNRLSLILMVELPLFEGLEKFVLPQ